LRVALYFLAMLDIGKNLIIKNFRFSIYYTQKPGFFAEKS